ncbi:MAG: hypothetical protein PF489_07985 [Salinivirgaceae bacterium]|nr:hypothetical protein [Salinivirgaceae bacterium]
MNDIEHERYSYSWVSCEETKIRLSDNLEETRRFVYITNIAQKVEVIKKKVEFINPRIDVNACIIWI